MDKGLWIWPSDPKGQKLTLQRITKTPHLMPALQGIVKSKEGMSNSELDELLGDNSNWITLWVVRQFTSLGFIEYKVDFFGGPARYVPTDLGRSALMALTTSPSSTLPTAAPKPH